MENDNEIVIIKIPYTNQNIILDFEGIGKFSISPKAAYRLILNDDEEWNRIKAYFKDS